MRLIDADAVRDKIEKMLNEPSYQHEGEDWQNGLIVAEMFLDDAPTVDAKPVRHGKWLCDDDFDENGICSECMYDSYEPVGYVRDEWEYCPRCGAKMDGKERA